MKNRMVVVGADGFIGQAFLEAMKKPGDVLPMDIVNWEVTAVDNWENVPADHEYDVIINCTIGLPESVRRNGRALFSDLPKSSVQPRVVHLSSMTVYGAAVGNLNEQTPLTAELGPYASAQLEVEIAASGYANAVILRPGVEYGPACPHWSGRIAQLLRAGRLGNLGAAGNGLCNLLYIDDLLRAIWRAATLPDVGGMALNLASGRALSWNTYFTEFAAALGLPNVAVISGGRLQCERYLLAVPLKALEIVTRKLGLNTDRVPQPITPSFLRSCVLNQELDVSAAERVLGLRWTPFSEGLRLAADYYRSGG